jgi:hypothetical protein
MSSIVLMNTPSGHTSDGDTSDMTAVACHGGDQDAGREGAPGLVTEHCHHPLRKWLPS